MSFSSTRECWHVNCDSSSGNGLLPASNQVHTFINTVTVCLWYNLPVERTSCRPDFAIHSYPVITLVPPYAHMGSRRNLLGDNPDAALVESLCNHLQVTAKMPPTFLFHTSEDTAVPPENSIMFYAALRKAGVPCELHIYEKGRHGVGLAANDPVLSTWPGRLEAWLNARGMLQKNSG